MGRYAISLYLSYTKSGSTYGAAGSLIVLLIWIYYSAQIFLLGAEFTQVYAQMFGSHQDDVQRPENAESRSPANQTALNSR
jgi:membrane protein